MLTAATQQGLGDLDVAAILAFQERLSGMEDYPWPDGKAAGGPPPGVHAGGPPPGVQAGGPPPGMQAGGPPPGVGAGGGRPPTAGE